MRIHHEPGAWQEAMALVRGVYRATESLSAFEQYGLAPQLRRAEVSIPSNIAEGAAREGTKGFAQFPVMACGSMGELETQLPIAEDLGCLRQRSLS